MNLCRVITVVVTAILGSTTAYYKCDRSRCISLENSLDQIEEGLQEQARRHKFSLYSNTYTGHFEELITQLNYKINNANKCSLLENQISAKCKAYGIILEGLESASTRLNKLFNFCDQRYLFYLEQTNQKDHLNDDCENVQFKLEADLIELNETNSNLEIEIANLKQQIETLKTEKQKLKILLNNNSPAIHGKTGVVYGVVPTDTPTTNEVTVKTTTEGPIPDIDLRVNNDTDLPQTGTVPTNQKSTIVTSTTRRVQPSRKAKADSAMETGS